MASTSWKLKLLGGFDLTSPAGERIQLPTRKSQGLLAILLLSPNRSCRRIDLQQELWPGTSVEKQQASLRQSLSHLRKTIGETNLQCSRENCRLSDTFHVECDASQLELALKDPGSHLPSIESEEFMPDSTEPWFERKRLRYQSRLGRSTQTVQKPHSTADSMPLEGLLSLIRWYVDREPPRALHLLRDHRDLVLGIAPRELQPIAEAVISGSPSDHPLLGWGYFWRGLCVLNSRDLGAGEALLQRAIEYGLTHKDPALQVEAGVYLAAGQIVEGRLRAAHTTTSMVRAVASRSSYKPLVARADTIAASLLLHQGQTEKALALMDVARDRTGADSTESANSDALHALYLAAAGYTDRADVLLKAPERMALETGHVSMDIISRLARSIIALKENERLVAIRLLNDLIVRCSNAHATHIEIYAREALALATYRENEKSAAAEQLRTSGKLRRSLRMAITEWDRTRLDELAVPFDLS